jgi:hypothetical protein
MRGGLGLGIGSFVVGVCQVRAGMCLRVPHELQDRFILFSMFLQYRADLGGLSKKEKKPRLWVRS